MVRKVLLFFLIVSIILTSTFIIDKLTVFIYSKKQEDYLESFIENHKGIALNNIIDGEKLIIDWYIPKRPRCDEIQTPIYVDINKTYLDVGNSYYVIPERSTKIQDLKGKYGSRYRDNVSDYRVDNFLSTGLNIPHFKPGTYGLIYRYEFRNCIEKNLVLAHSYSYVPNIVEAKQIIWFNITEKEE